MVELLDYFRSSASFRVRIVLNLKEIEHQLSPISLLDGEQKSADYKAINPAGLVPTLMTEEGKLSQSLAIIEYLDECYPQSPLLPNDPWQRAQVRSLALQICCDIHPLNNLRVLQYLNKNLEVSDEQKTEWYHHWLAIGFEALEAELQHGDTLFSYSDTPNLLDVCLIPQIFNALRFELDMTPYPTLLRIYQYGITQKSIKDALPD
jgi:maleylacetoacetate isomerase